jgi:diglucosylglycerate octanoyltransferase
VTTRDGDPLRLVVLGDSLAFTDATGPQLPTHPGLYPSVLARALSTTLDREVTTSVLARPGATVRDTTRLATKDRHVQFEVLAHADAVVVAVGSFDHAPMGVPAALESLVPYVRPAAARRRLRRGLRRVYPRVVRATRGRLRRTPSDEFVRLYGQLLTQVAGLSWGRAAGVVLGPTSHRSAYYGHLHPLHARTEAQQLALAARHGFPGVRAWPLVEPHLAELNPDGIHWPTAVHEAVGAALARPLLTQLEGETPRPPLPSW